MTDTIRPKIDAIAPALQGQDGRTLSSIYDALIAMAQALDGRLATITQTVQPLDGKLDTIAQAVQPLDGKLDTANDWLDAIAGALGAAPYGDLELGSIRGFLSNIQTASGKISRAVGESDPPEPYLAIRPYLSALLAGQSAARTEAQAAGNILSGNILQLETPLINIDTNLSVNGSVNTMISQLSQELGDKISPLGGKIDGVTDTILSTSGSIRGEIGAVVDAVAGGASATVAEIITARDEIKGSIGAARAGIEGAIGTAQNGIEGAIGTAQNEISAKLDTLDTLLNAAFGAQGARHAELMSRLLDICFAVGGCDS